MFCEKRITTPDYLTCLKAALGNGFERVISYCESKSKDANLEDCMYYAVDRGIMNSVVYIIEGSPKFDLRPYIKYLVECRVGIRRFEVMKYLESLTDEPIDWGEMTPWRNQAGDDTEMTRYVDSKLQSAF